MCCCGSLKDQVTIAQLTKQALTVTCRHKSRRKDPRMQWVIDGVNQQPYTKPSRLPHTCSECLCYLQPPMHTKASCPLLKRGQVRAASRQDFAEYYSKVISNSTMPLPPSPQWSLPQLNHSRLCHPQRQAAAKAKAKPRVEQPASAGPSKASQVTHPHPHTSAPPHTHTQVY